MLIKQRKAEARAIYACLINYHKFAQIGQADSEYISELIELGIYNHAVRKAHERHLQISWQDRNFYEIYSNLSYNVKVNLDIQSSVNGNHNEKTKTFLVSKMYEFYVHHVHASRDGGVESAGSPTGMINPESLGSASSIDLNPHINEVYLNEINIRQQQGIVMKFSEMYPCEKCNKRKSRIREIQSASLDEGSTLFITCIACGNRWRQYS
jgi:DNA-directed RNA polymerase subunit M/transcription elongation factor TFIIS